MSDVSADDVCVGATFLLPDDMTVSSEMTCVGAGHGSIKEVKRAETR